MRINSASTASSLMVKGVGAYGDTQLAVELSRLVGVDIETVLRSVLRHGVDALRLSVRENNEVVETLGLLLAIDKLAIEGTAYIRCIEVNIRRNKAI